MAKYYGLIGFGISEETKPGVYQVKIHERPYYGEVKRNTHRFEAGEVLNQDFTVNNEISIVADPFAYQNFHTIRYVEWYGARFEVKSVEVKRPRLLLSIGGEYHGQ